MRTPTSLLAIFAATMLASPGRSQEGAKPASKGPTQDSVKKVMELKKERLAALESMTDQFERLYQATHIELGELLESRQLLFAAQLESATTESERVELYKRLVKTLRQYEEIARAKTLAGTGTEANRLKAKAKRLEAEIRLEEAKMKIASAGKQPRP